MASFDPKSFSRNEWGILGGVFVAFVGLFFSAYSVSVKGAKNSVLNLGGYSYDWSGWHFAGLWVPVLIIAVPAAALVALRALRADLIPTLPIGTRFLVLALLAVAMLIELIRGLTYPSSPISQVSAGASFGTYIVTIATFVALAFAALDFKESGEELPKLPAKPAGTPTPTDTPEG